MKASLLLQFTVVALLLTTSTELQARKIECRFGQHVRIIDTKYPQAKTGLACKVTYHKPTEGIDSRELWNARNDVSYCDEKAWLLANKLENGGWICNSIYEATSDNKVIYAARTTDGSANIDAPASPSGFRQLLEQDFRVIFETKAHYYYGEDNDDCIEAGCQRFFEYRNQFNSEPVAFFGYRVSNKIKLWMDLECGGSNCWGHLYKQEGQEIRKLLLPEFETGIAFNIFLKSQNAGFPDLWLPISHSSSDIVEVRLLRYQNGSYKTLAHLRASPEPELQAASKRDSGLLAGEVTLKARYEGDVVELVYETQDIDYEGLLLKPSK